MGNVLPFFIIGSESVIDSSQASILMSTVPFFTIQLVHVFKVDESFSLQKLARLVIGFGGIIILF
jgi:drug/metabolite transporter (DMT)-like permease